MLLDFIEHFFSRQEGDPRGQAKQRLKLILAHDRADLTPVALESMRQEILAVVARYVEIDAEGLQFDLASEGNTTALIANLPIRRVRPDPSQPDPNQPDDSQAWDPSGESTNPDGAAL